MRYLNLCSFRAQARRLRPSCVVIPTFFVAAIISSLGLNSSRAATVTWTAGTTGSNKPKWEKTGNWSSGAVPTTSDDLVFTGTAPSTTASIAGAQGANSITFTTTAAAYTLDGAFGFTVGAGGLTNNSINTQTINFGTITLTVPQTWNAVNGALAVSSGITTGTNTLTVSGSAQTTLSGVITGTAATAIIKSGSGTLIISGSNGFTGSTILNAGQILLGSNKALGSGTLSLVSGTLGVTGTQTSVTVANTVAAASGTNSITVASGKTLVLSGSLSGASKLVKIGAGLLSFTGTSSHTGGGDVQGGTFSVDGSLSGDPLNVSSGGTFGGGGTVGAVTVQSGGTIAPYQGTFGTTLHTGALSLSSGGTFSMTIGSNSFSDISVTGAVTLSGSLSITLVGAAVPTIVPLILNDATDNISGTFTGLAEGAQFTSGGATWQITYKGNYDGGNKSNDVVLTLIAIPEGSTSALALSGVFGLGILAFRRRRANG